MRMIKTQKLNTIHRYENDFHLHQQKKHSTRLTLGGNNESTQRVRVGAEPEVRITSADEINGKSTNLFALFRVH